MQTQKAEATSRPKLRRDAQRNRARIIESAKAVFGERGRETTLDDIAAHAGLGVGTVYRNYPNKKALLEQLFEEPLRRLLAFVDDASRGANAWDGLIGFISLLGELCAENPVLAYEFAHAEGGLDGVRMAAEQLAGPVGQLVLGAKDEGRLRSDFEAADIGVINTMLVAVITASHRDAPDLWRRYLVMIVDGLQPCRSKPTPFTFFTAVSASDDAAGVAPQSTSLRDNG